MPNIVLLVDDNPMVRGQLRQMFVEAHPEWTIAEACDGQEGIEKAAQLAPDLVVIDFTMPVMNGLEAAVHIKRGDPLLPLILFTAFKSTTIEKEAFARGFSYVVSKADAAQSLIEAAAVLLKYRGRPQSND